VERRGRKEKFPFKEQGEGWFPAKKSPGSVYFLRRGKENRAKKSGQRLVHTTGGVDSLPVQGRKRKKRQQKGGKA